MGQFREDTPNYTRLARAQRPIDERTRGGDAVSDWLEDFNNTYAEVADVFERLRSILDESTIGTWETMVRDLPGESSIPA